MSTSSPWPGPRRDAESSPPNPVELISAQTFCGAKTHLAVHHVRSLPSPLHWNQDNGPASVWYQIPTFNPAEDAASTTSLQDNADEWVFLRVGFPGVCITFFPVIPGPKRIPNWLLVHRLIWRLHHKKYGNRHLI